MRASVTKDPKVRATSKQTRRSAAQLKGTEPARPCMGARRRSRAPAGGGSQQGDARSPPRATPARDEEARGGDGGGERGREGSARGRQPPRDRFVTDGGSETACDATTSARASCGRSSPSLKEMLVEGGHRLVGRADLRAQQGASERLVVRAVGLERRACRSVVAVGLVGVFPRLAAPMMSSIALRSSGIWSPPCSSLCRCMGTPGRRSADRRRHSRGAGGCRTAGRSAWSWSRVKYAAARGAAARPWLGWLVHAGRGEQV